MKLFAALTLAVSTFAAVSAAQAQDRQLFVYSGSVAVELPASTLRGSAPVTPEASSTRKVRIVLQSPYGN